MEDWIAESDKFSDCDPDLPIIEGDEEDLDLIKSLANEMSYAGKKLTTDKRVPGRINNSDFFSFWENELKASPFVLNTLKDGYRFPFHEIPPSGIACNNRSALKERDFVKAELPRLEALGCIEKVTKRPYLVLPLSVVFSKKLRLVVDASRGLNIIW